MDASPAHRSVDRRVPRASPGRRPLAPLLLLVAFALLAVGLGVMGRVTSTSTFRGAWELSRIGGPWLAGAFVAGMLAGWRRPAATGAVVLGATGGAIAIAGGSLTYYAIYRWIEEATTTWYAVVVGTGWAAAGVAVGGAIGALGALATTPAARPWLRGLAIGVLAGLLMGESIALLWVWEDGGLRKMALLEGAAGCVALGGAILVGWRAVIASLPAVLVTATFAPLAATALRETLRRFGWGGA
ncbi:MAG: hypothetical protein M0P31_05995 [Solirubrobacteraceae bacterium]|nr:hypothetical protein [Solirubrobacteraceae bacterium]